MKDGERSWLELRKMLRLIQNLDRCPDCGERFPTFHKLGCEVAMAERFLVAAKYAKVYNHG